MKFLQIITLILSFAVPTAGLTLIGTASGVGPVVSAVASATIVAAVSTVDYYFNFIPNNLFMITICGKINRNNNRDCVNPVQAGTRDNMYVLNFDDIDSVTYAADGYTVENITLKATKTAFIIEGKNNSITPRYEMVEQGVNDMFDHEVVTKGFDISPEAKSDLNAAKDGRYVIFCENLFKGTNGNSAFEIYGLTTGLEISALSRMPNDADTQGAFDITFFTKTNKEPKMPNPFFNTDYATTKAAVDALLV